MMTDDSGDSKQVAVRVLSVLLVYREIAATLSPKGSSIYWHLFKIY